MTNASEQWYGICICKLYGYSNLCEQEGTLVCISPSPPNAKPPLVGGFTFGAVEVWTRPLGFDQRASLAQDAVRRSRTQ